MCDYRELRSDHARVREEIGDIKVLLTQREAASKDSGSPHDPCSAESTDMPGAAPKNDGASKDSEYPHDLSSRAFVSDK